MTESRRDPRFGAIMEDCHELNFFAIPRRGSRRPDQAAVRHTYTASVGACPNCFPRALD